MSVIRKAKCEVVIVGGGNAALVAAMQAKDLGIDVLLLEKAPREKRGGNSRLSGGLFRIAANGTPDFLAMLDEIPYPKESIEIEPYSKDDFYNTVLRLSQGLSDKRLVEIFVNRSLETVAYMKEKGVKWELNPAQMYKVNGRLLWASGATVLMAKGAGEGLVEMEYEILEKENTNILYRTAARSLIVDSEGKVCGVIAKSPEGMIEIEAKHVILACGGFQGNPALRRQYLGENWDLVKLRGSRYNTGDGLLMAIQVGAQFVGHWGGCHASVVSEDSPMIEAASAGSERYSYPYCIMVNRDGKRFVDEGEDFMVYTYAKIGKEILKQPGGVAFQIFDAKVIPLLRVEYQDAIKVESNSLEELADELNINKENFLETVRTFNESIIDDKPFIPYRRDGRRTKGLNPEKTNWAQTIDKPPFQAYAVTCGLTMTYGGLKTNERAEVIDTQEQPVKGLYAIGEVTGGFFYHNYPSGTGLVRGAVMGRIVANEVARNL